MVELEKKPYIVELSIQKHESAKSQNIRTYAIDDGITIKLAGITDYKWKIYEPLLNALRTTRIQTESGEVQISPISYEKVRGLFPKDTRWVTIYNTLQMLNNSLAPSGWSIVRQAEATKKPIDAPWFLGGPDDNGVQNKAQPKPKQENIHDRTVSEDKKQVAMKRFDRLAFGTSLLHQCLSNLTNPDAKAIFTKDPAQAMLSLLPTDIKLQDLIDKKTPLEYFQESIENAVNSMRGRNYQQLSEKQQTIIELWEELKKQSGQPPKTVVFEHFSRPNSNKPLDQGNNDTS